MQARRKIHALLAPCTLGAVAVSLLACPSSAISAQGAVSVFRSADRVVECADEPADAIGVRPGVNCYSGSPSSGCDGEVIALTGIAAHGRAFPLHRGCAGGSPLDYGEEPVFTVLRVGQGIVKGGVACRLRRGDTIRCRNRSGHGFRIGPKVARRF